MESGITWRVMMSSHLLRQYGARQLSLVEGGDDVVVMGTGRMSGSTLEVHAPTLLRRLEDLSKVVEWIAFVDSLVPDGATLAVVDDMLAAMENRSEDGLVQFREATEAVKRVEAGTVVSGVDRSGLVSVRSPELLRRSALVASASAVGERIWVNPTAILVESGFEVALYSGQRSAAGR